MSTITFEWDAELTAPLVCTLEYEEAEEAQLYGDAPYPGYPAYCTLLTASVNGVDIVSLLSDKLIERIEIAAADQYEREPA